MNCLDETTIHVDTILYLSLYILVNHLTHLPNPTIRISSIYLLELINSQVKFNYSI